MENTEAQEINPQIEQVTARPTIYVTLQPDGDVEVRTNVEELGFIATIGFLELAKQKVSNTFLSSDLAEEIKEQAEQQAKEAYRKRSTLLQHAVLLPR